MAGRAKELFGDLRRESARAGEYITGLLCPLAGQTAFVPSFRSLVLRRPMLAPQFSIRRLMGWTIVFALGSLILSYANRGNAFATAVAWMFFLAIATALTFGLMFIVASLFAGGFRRLKNIGSGEEAGSPFAEHRPPPRMVRPEEPH